MRRPGRRGPLDPVHWMQFSFRLENFSDHELTKGVTRRGQVLEDLMSGEKKLRTQHFKQYNINKGWPVGSGSGKTTDPPNLITQIGPV